MALRKAAGFSQTELADLIGEPQANIAYWERSEKPPRSDVLPRMAEALGVRIEDLLDSYGPAIARRPKSAGQLNKLFEDVRKLPRRQQQKVLEVVAALVDQYRRKAS
jgi:transcriptional regulator with XRE-family HTH domain